MRKSVVSILALCSILMASSHCHREDANASGKSSPDRPQSSKGKPLPDKIIVDIIPFDGIPEEVKKSVLHDLKEILPTVTLQSQRALPANSYYAPRKRYKADTLLTFLSSITPKGHVSIGITDKDISTAKGSIEDWGVMGLSFFPGNACVVSTFRLDKSNLREQFFKTAIHELGHTQGLDHCPVKTCYMRDAEGKNPTDEETGFCPACKAYLVQKGWLIK